MISNIPKRVYFTLLMIEEICPTLQALRRVVNGTELAVSVRAVNIMEYSALSFLSWVTIGYEIQILLD